MTEVVSLQQKQECRYPYAQTPTLKRIGALLDICHKTGLLGVVVGEPGTGKSIAIAAYAANHTGVFISRMNKTTSSGPAMLAKLCREILGFTDRVAPFVLLDKLVEQITLYEGVELLVIDEVQYLDDDALNILRDLYDIKEQLGVVLVGNDRFIRRFNQPSGRVSIDQEARYAALAPLRGRISKTMLIPAPLEQDIQAICEFHGIKGKEAWQIVKKIANKEGALRKVADLLSFAERLAPSKQTSYSLPFLKAAQQFMGEM